VEAFGNFPLEKYHVGNSFRLQTTFTSSIGGGAEQSEAEGVFSFPCVPRRPKNSKNF